MHKPLLAIIAALLVAGFVLFAVNRKSQAPEKGATDQPVQMTAQPSTINEAKVIDLTYSFDENTIYWPTAQPFKWEKESWGKAAGGYW